MNEFEQLSLYKKVLGVIPAAGSGSRMTPRWTIVDPFLDALAKPAMVELSSGKPFLELIFDTLLGDPVVSHILVRVGHRPKSKENCESEIDKIKYKQHSDLVELVKNRTPVVQIYYSNADGQDEGTGATVVAREAKEFLIQHSEFQYILILASDIPNIPANLFKEMILTHVRNGNDMTIASVVEDDPFNYGRIVRHPQTGEFIAVVEQSEIGKSKEDRAGAISFTGLTEPLPKKYLHQIKERNVLLEIINRDMFLKAIRDIDAPNYARVIKDEQGIELELIPNSTLQTLKEKEVFQIKGKEFYKSAFKQILECRKFGPNPPETYVLKRHKNNEYYLPELAMEVKSQHKKVGIFSLPKGTAQGFDSRTDLRQYAFHQPNAVARFKSHLQPSSSFTTEFLILLKEPELEVLEQVFAVTIEPFAEVYAAPEINCLLTKLADQVIRIGGAKEFCQIYQNELKSKTLNKIPGLGTVTSETFYLGAQTVIKGKVGFIGSINISPWVTISNSLIQNSQIARNQMVKNKVMLNNVERKVAE